MKAKNLVKSIIALCMALFLFISLPCFERSTYAADGVLEIKLNVYSQSIVKGKSLNLRVYNLQEGQTVSYRSSKSSVATVDSAGRITAVSIGNAVIFVTVSDAAKNTVERLQCSITVGPAAQAIMFTRFEVNLLVGEKLTLDKIIYPLNTVEAPKFSSLNDSVASVSAGGRVTAKKEGSTFVFAQIDNGKWTSCKINVSSAPEEEKNTLQEEKRGESEAVTTEVNDNTNKNDELNESTSTSKVPEEVLSTKEEVVDFEAFLEKLNAVRESEFDLLFED